MADNHEGEAHDREGIRLIGSGAGGDDVAGGSGASGWQPPSSDSLAWPPRPDAGHPLSAPDQSGGWALPDASGPIDVGSMSGGIPMQSWTDPPTGQVPAIIATDDDDDDLATRTTGAPRWRGRGDWGESDFNDDLMDTEGTRLGAMDESKPHPADLFNFDDPRQPAPPAQPPAPAWGEGHVPPPSGGPAGGAAGYPAPGAGTPSGGVAGWPGGAGPGSAGPAGPATWGPGSGPQALAGDGRTDPTDPGGRPPFAPTEPSGEMARDASGPVGPGSGPTAMGAPPMGAAPTGPPTPGSNWGAPDVGWSQDPSGTATMGTAQIRTRNNRVLEPPAGTEPMGGRDMGTAAIVGGALLLVSIAVFFFGPLWLAAGLVTILVTGCALEIFSAIQRAGLRPALLLGMVSVVSMMFAVYLRGVSAIPLVLALTFLATMLWYLLGVVHGRPLVGIATTLMAAIWTGVLGSFATAILHDGSLAAYHIDDHKAGVVVLFGAVICGVAYDLGGLLVGTLFGTRPLAPHISPGKTIEGTLGGFLLALLAGVATGVLSDVWGGWWHGLVLGLVAGAAAIAGDLCQSLVKRDLGIKDMGTALPGHGGFLDRFDSVLFVLPCVYYLAGILLAGG